MLTNQTLIGRLRLAVVALSLALLVACGGDGDDTSAGDDDATTTTAAIDDEPTDAPDSDCPIDEAQLSAAIEIEMVAMDTGDCSFEATSPGAGRLIEVHYTTVDDFVFDGSEGEDVAGVGDGAKWDTDLADSLVVKAGSRYFSVQVLAMGTDLPENLKAKALATTVAQLVLA